MMRRRANVLKGWMVAAPLVLTLISMRMCA